MIVHHASRAQLDGLFRLFAKPVERNGAIDWLVPAWLQVMYATAAR